MSRIGKIPVSIPKEVKVNVSSDNVHVEGPKGKLDIKLPLGIKVEFKDQLLKIDRTSHTKQDRANHGTVRSHLVNMVVGVTQGHKRELEIQGIGLRAQLQGKKVVFNFGFSHPVEFEVPSEVKISVPTQTNLIVEGADIAKVTHVASQLRRLKPVEPYKGKGVRYTGEIVRRKQGKSVTK